MKDKEQLVCELVRCKGLLNTTVEIDKEQSSLKEAERAQIQSKISKAHREALTLNNKIKD